MFGLEIEVRNLRLLTYTQYLLEHLPQTTRWVLQTVVAQYRDPLLERLSRGPAVHYPFIFTTLRQKIWYLKQIPKGQRGGRYVRRPDGIEKSWAETTEIGSGEFVAAVHFKNEVPGVQFVQGFRQQPGHIASGWPYAPDLIMETETQMVGALGTELVATFRELRSIQGEGS